LLLELLGWSVVEICTSGAPDEIKRVRAIRRADGYGVQFCINVERVEESIPTGKSCWNRCRIESFLH
jgi:hypothetical protein